MREKELVSIRGVTTLCGRILDIAEVDSEADINKIIISVWCFHTLV